MPDFKIPKGLPIRPQQTNADEKIRGAAKMYEQYFLNEMVKSMRKTVDRAEAPQMGERIYSEQLDDQYVQSWSDQGGIGLADIIYNQLQDRFFGGGKIAPHPSGPLPIDKGTHIKIDETRQLGIPVISPKTTGNEVSFLYEWDEVNKPATRDVMSPFAGQVLQAFRTSEERQSLKIAHDDGLVSTLSFVGQTKALQPGQQIAAGQKIGQLSPEALGLTWQIGQVEV